MLRLDFGLDFSDLYTSAGLSRLDGEFLRALGEAEPQLHERLRAGRAAPGSLARKAESQLLIELARVLEDFIARLFGIEAELAALRARHDELAPLYACRRQFVQRKALSRVSEEQARGLDGAQLEAQLAGWFGEPFTELGFARHVEQWQREEAGGGGRLDAAVHERIEAAVHERIEAAVHERIEAALRYAAWAVRSEAGRARHAGGVLFKVPHKLDALQLVPVTSAEEHGVTVHRLAELRRREGFALTDAGTDLAGALAEANYCIWCHEQGKDSCSTGLKDKPARPGAPAPFRKSALGVKLAGCPLEERISEFQQLKAEGRAIGALAMICVDNPLVAATGHRICNDCMKSCIYQKQEPVDIPQAETRTLKDVLELPWGFEIYGLLTRWNPLKLAQACPAGSSGKRVLIAGMGPAGFTLAHLLLNRGHTVVGVDGLKIEPLPQRLSGVSGRGERVEFEPVREVSELYEALDTRVMAGFGGVAEYGITVRWDKNFLKIVRLLLERRERFALLGGVRFGGTLGVEEAFGKIEAGGLGFDHIALAAGAGRPTVIEMDNALARGVRTASDFLMALQLTGAARAESVANLQLRLPVVVIGGGLTAIDTATEAAAYYPVQVEKFLARYETLAAERGEARVRAGWDEEERSIAEEFLAHARALRAERAAARKEGRAARIAELIRSWGGVLIAYRKRLIDSPAYTLNHEEVQKALEEGIGFAEGLAPAGVEVDGYGHARAMRMRRAERAEDGAWTDKGEIRLDARAILIAAGTQPNTVAAREDPANFSLDGGYFEACDEQGRPVEPERNMAKPGQARVLMRQRADGRFMSFFGDLHPSYFGNVVKAMGGAKQGAAVLERVLGQVAPAAGVADAAFLRHVNTQLRASVEEVKRLTPNIVEVIVKAPLAARRFRPGQFYRLQNYEAKALRSEGTLLAMEGIALTGAWVDRERGLVSTIALEMGGSSDLCALLEQGEPVVLMGPTGSPTEIVAGGTVLLAGGGLGNAVLFSIGQALRRAGTRVLYFAGYKRLADRYKVEEIEAAADAVVWCCDEAPGFTPSRAQDKSYVGNIVAAMLAYAGGDLGEHTIGLNEASRLIVIGSQPMMAAVAAAREGRLGAHLEPGLTAIGSINSPMQCMMKEICAQCLQPQIDPASGKASVVFSCFNQDQALERVDFAALGERLRQNSLQEKLTALWIDRCLRRLQLRSAAA